MAAAASNSSSSLRVAHEPATQKAVPAESEVKDVVMKDTLTEVSFGNISYGSSELLLAMKGPGALPLRSENVMIFLRQYELVRSTKSTTAYDYRTHIVSHRKQKQLEDFVAAPMESSAGSIDRGHEKLKNDCKRLTQKKMRESKKCFPGSCVQGKETKKTV